MGQSKSSSHPPDEAHDHHAARHAAPVETEEQQQDRLKSAAVQHAWSRRFARPAALLAIVSAGLSLAYLGTLCRHAPSMNWPWLLTWLLALTWFLALARGPAEERVDS